MDGGGIFVESAEDQGIKETASEERGEGTEAGKGCCDMDGHCHVCGEGPGPQDDYNMWDNLYIFPG